MSRSQRLVDFCLGTACQEDAPLCATYGCGQFVAWIEMYGTHTL